MKDTFSSGSYLLIWGLLVLVVFFGCNPEAEEEEPGVPEISTQEACSNYCDKYVSCTEETVESCTENCGHWYNGDAISKCYLTCSSLSCDSFWDCLQSCNEGGGSQPAPY